MVHSPLLQGFSSSNSALQQRCSTGRGFRKGELGFCWVPRSSYDENEHSDRLFSSLPAARLVEPRQKLTGRLEEVEMPAAEAAAPAPSEQHVRNCEFSKWHPLFKHCTPRSVVLELPEDVVQYLQEDGVVLPKGFEMSCGKGVQGDSDDEVDWGDEDEHDDDRVSTDERLYPSGDREPTCACTLRHRAVVARDRGDPHWAFGDVRLPGNGC